MVGARCSPLGIGTDIGGSIRIPAAFCGVYCLKPTPQRLSHKGLSVPRRNGRSGNLTVLPTVGPLGQSLVMGAGGDTSGWCTYFVAREWATWS
jgi:Asp-tRNA(Asn)/Glu-tRNA(Gln) amidotransferase A subunit family amidase